MSRKLLQKALTAPNNLRFTDLVKLARVSTSDYLEPAGAITFSFILGFRELLNLQEVRGQAKLIKLASSTGEQPPSLGGD